MTFEWFCNMADENNEGKTLYDAAEADNLKLVQSLLDGGVSPDSYKTKHGTTALIRASEKGLDKVVALLLVNGADPSHVNGFKESMKLV